MSYRTSPIANPGMPPGIPHIIGDEAAERFSFYGMRGIPVAFMTTHPQKQFRDEGSAGASSTPPLAGDGLLWGSLSSIRNDRRIKVKIHQVPLTPGTGLAT